MIFDIENSLWKSKISTFWQTDGDTKSVTQKVNIHYSLQYTLGIFHLLHLILVKTLFDF